MCVCVCVCVCVRARAHVCVFLFFFNLEQWAVNLDLEPQFLAPLSFKLLDSLSLARSLARSFAHYFDWIKVILL